MDIKSRAALVRSLRCEIKQSREDQISGHRRLATLGRAQRRVDRWNAGNRQRMTEQNQRNREVYGRIGERIDSRISAAMTERARQQRASDRAMNMRQAERIRTEGYDITPRFARRAAAIRLRAESAGMRERAGTGVNRWRGTVRQTGADLRASPPHDYDAAVLASRRSRSDPLNQSPADYTPTPRRRRNPPGELRTSRRRN
jgi:hypothetical protein